MDCYFAWDPKTNTKVLIPGCYGSLHREDKAMCTCKAYIPDQRLDTSEQKLLREEVKFLQQENKQLIRLLEKLTKREIK